MLGSGRSKAIALLGGAAVIGSLVVASPAASTSVIAEISTTMTGWTVATDTLIPGPVYMASAGMPQQVVKVDPASNTISATIQLPLPGTQNWVATGSSADDSVYVTSTNPQAGADDTLYVIGADDTIRATYVSSGGVDLYSPAVRSSSFRDDTLYVGATNRLLVLDAPSLSLEHTVPLTGNAEYVAVVRDDTVVATTTSNLVYILNAATDDSMSISSIPSPTAVALSSDGGSVYVVDDTFNSSMPSLYKINVSTGQIDDSLVVGGGLLSAQNVAVAPNGPIYLTMLSPAAIVVIDPTTLDVTSTITQGVSNPYGIAASANGRAYASSSVLMLVIGTSSPAPPTPSPVFPPDAPRDVAAVAGDGQATVTWTAPTSSGSFPITNYLAKSAPGGKTCLVAAPAMTCTVTGLTNGTAYTFTAQALNGAGWSASSAPSDAVTPDRGETKLIVITGARSTTDPRLIMVRGSSTGLAGATATPFVRLAGQSGHTEGTGKRTIGADGSFEWQRKTGKRASVYFTSGDVRSNTVVIAAR